MGEHDAPSSWLDRWREAEPVRLYLWGVACAVIVLAGVAGWLTAELAVAVTGVAAALLMLPATAWARRQTYAPLTVDRLLDEQHGLSFRQGVGAAEEALERARRPLRRTEEPTVSQVVAAETRELAAVVAETDQVWPRQALQPCPFMDEDGRRCVLPWHPSTFGHRLEEDRGVVGE